MHGLQDKMVDLNDLILIVPALISFLVAYLLIPVWIKKAHAIKLLWTDMNKSNKPLIAGSGGVMGVLGFLIGVLTFIAYRVFYLHNNTYLIEILAVLLVVVFASGIGLIDDLMGWRRCGLSRRSRLALLLFAAVPLMAINAGRAIIDVPGLGNVNLGIIYPLFFIPIGVAGATSTYNFLAGYNGLEAGQGILILSGLAVVAIFTGSIWLGAIALCMIASLTAFILFNFYPARVFPGDSLTYAIGSLIAVMAVVGNFEKVAVFFFMPYIVETFLKARGRLAKYSFGRPLKDGTLELSYDKIYGLEHLAIYLLRKLNIRSTEKNVVFLLWSFQLMIILIGLLIFKEGIFFRT